MVPCSSGGFRVLRVRLQRFFRRLPWAHAIQRRRADGDPPEQGLRQQSNRSRFAERRMAARRRPRRRAVKRPGAVVRPGPHQGRSQNAAVAVAVYAPEGS